MRKLYSIKRKSTGYFINCMEFTCGNLYFGQSISENSKGFREIWKSDGTYEKTIQLIKLDSDNISYGSYENPELYNYSPKRDKVYVRNIVAGENTLYIITEGFLNGCELWKSNGFEWGTKKIYDFKSIYPHKQEDDVINTNQLTIGDTLFFVANSDFAI